MKNIILYLTFFIIATPLFAQKINRISITNMGQTEMLTISTTDNAIINLSPQGEVINYGTEYFSERVQNYSRVEPFTGRVELFTDRDDKAFTNKVRYIGRSGITYYASYEDSSLRGKVKTLGILNFTYYMPFDNEAEKGKIKSIGTSSFTYYSSFENKELQGKLKSIGNTAITFYNSFEDKAFRGKLKSIGNVSFTYFPSWDRQSPGAMKTGNQMQNLVGGINYIIR